MVRIEDVTNAPEGEESPDGGARRRVTFSNNVTAREPDNDNNEAEGEGEGQQEVRTLNIKKYVSLYLCFQYNSTRSRCF